jgi:lipopolysaccharide assembly outer membrane protein LptD (OstA)
MIEKIRHKLIKLENMVLAAVMLLLLCSQLYAQEPESRRARRNAREKSEVQNADFVRAAFDTRDTLIAAHDSLHRADSISAVDSINLLKKSSLEMPAFTAAKDSIVEDFSNGKRMIYYYGDVSVKYGNLQLTADYMEYDLKSNTLFARGTKDTSGVITGMPTMTQGNTTYTMEEVRYNFTTKKSFIVNMVTQEADGILHGKNIKMMPDNSINIKNGKYTVCDCPEPHYYLHLSAAKVMTKPNQKTVFGPAWPVVADVPLPIALPFGFIPKKPDRATGLLMPTFGEEQRRGFYLRDAGMYFVIGDYFDISMTGDYYTLGSWALNLNSRYKVNYKCTGNFSLSYSNNQTGEKGSTDFFQSRDFGVKWSHSQDSKARPGTSFTASVNFSSPSNNKFNSQSVQEALQSSISSSISYSRNWNGKFNLSINGLHSQNTRDSSYSFTLTNVTFSVNRFYPFKRKNRVGKERFYEKFSIGYNTAFQNKISFKAKEFGQPDFFNKFQNGMNHNFQIGLPQFTLLKYLNFSPSVTYGMNWFFQNTEKVYNSETERVEDVKSKMFSHFGATHNYSAGMSMSTRVYGMFMFGKHRKLQAIRHVMSPSLSLSLSPDKAKHFNGWRTLNYTDKNGVEKTMEYNIYQGQMYSPPGRGRTAALSFSLGNNLEAKVRDLRDTTGTGTKKIKLIDQLNLQTGYNFLADSLRMSDIGISMSTSVFGKIGLQGNINLNPYAIDENGRTINKFMILHNGNLARLTRAGASFSYAINGNGSTRGDTGGGAADAYTRIYYHPVTGEYIPGGYLYYMNANSPWSMNFNFNYSYQKNYQNSNGQLLTKHNHMMTIGFNGSVQLTNAFSMTLSSGFDVIKMRLSTTQLSAAYDLHCFNIQVSWVPTGTWQSWSFRIAANAAALQDILKFKKSSIYSDNSSFWE